MKVQAEATPFKIRDKFMKLIKAGKTIGEASDACGITTDTACEIINDNIVSIEMLSEETK